ncbi:DUF4056 domain-containing protein [Ideonella alba]|uniref:DUF4056 domain-containing protein n=1 Tax=Ideonella alba TaxID=2824118 RepID=A0A941BCB3_9BURK|nr:DUF4056 domain-containing protein [Ideonella alba]MBQ0931755.1 DUF4056 domain-containing protein [Ideonella alba]
MRAGTRRSADRARWRRLVVLTVALTAGPGLALPPERDDMPSRRFGQLPTPYVMPLLRNRIIERADLGRHDWRSHADENDGLVYTCAAGFLDIDHLRDAADWTGHLYRLLRREIDRGATALDAAGSDGSTRLSLRWRRPVATEAGLDNARVASMASQLVWWMLTWHEVLTWLGQETLPPVSERASAFSYEDGVSHLVGLQVAQRALRRPEPWDVAVTRELDTTLTELGAVDRDSTFAALERVRDRWWNSHRAWPSNGFVMRRHLDSGLDGPISGWQVDGLPACDGAPARPWTLDVLATPGWQVQAWLTSDWGPLRERLAWPAGAGADAQQMRIELPAGMRAVLDTISAQVLRELGPNADRPTDPAAAGSAPR